MSKFKIGDKVVPFSKTSGQSLEHSGNWAMAQDINQPFLYVNSFEGTGAYACGYRDVHGDFFNEVDLVLYEENTIDTNLPKITEEQLTVIEHLKESWGILTMIEFHLSHEVWSGERVILNGIEPLDFIRVVLNDEYEIIESELAWTFTPDELELNKLTVRSNWDTWKKAKEEYKKENLFSDENKPFYINVNNKGLGFTIGDAKKIRDYLIKKIDFLESE